jgi:hypothetical protein
MKKWLLFTIGVVLALFVILDAGQEKAVSPASIPNEPYFGQKAPGETPQLFAPGIVSTGANELSVTISPDLNEFYVSRCSPDWTTSIVCFTRSASGWSGPQLAPFTRGLGDVYPFYSAKERAVFFNSQRPLPGITIAARLFRLP